MGRNLINSDFEVVVSVDLNEDDDIAHLRKKAAKKIRCKEESLPALMVKKKSIDARRGHIAIVYTLGCEGANLKASLTLPQVKARDESPVIIIGGGPAGLFCALELARFGARSIICERGKMVQARRKDLKGLNQHGLVDADSNYCFGEGGAGTYSDGKLYTRSHKRGCVRDILETLVSFGADSSILTDARPHIGSNKLPRIITAMRNALEAAGHSFIFGARVVDVQVKNQRAYGIKLADGREIDGKALVFATGHSARDSYEIMQRIGAKLLPKPFAVGVRIEHPQALINQIQYGRFVGHVKLKAAAYRLAYTPSDGRGAFSFCMCPGGWIVPAATESHGLVVNGMSLSKRDSAFANSGLVVAVSSSDLLQFGYKGPFGGIVLQTRLEQEAMKRGGGDLVAPAVRATDFIKRRISKTLPQTSYIPGLRAENLDEIFAVTGLPIAERLREALIYFNRLMPGYLTEDAVLVGVESRTSSTVRILRDPKTLQSNIEGLFPCGEGAGYAGGIVSAAMDGINVARAIITH